MDKRPKQVTKPVLSFKFKDGHELRIWVLDPGQYCILGPTSSFEFPHNRSDKNASLIYEELSVNSHNATEYNLDNQSTWEWIQKWMETGYKAEGLM